ncbi:MAG: hypothetical protein J0I09_08065 [Sphingobacteriia bacterium]|nr:hypothetical protein [Sphingobacteriia bacterium]
MSSLLGIVYLYFFSFTINYCYMGLYVQSLDSLPKDQHRDYYIYLLDYGWDEPLGEALFKNVGRMAEIAEQSNAVVIHSSNRVHFADQVLSWHHVNGDNAEQLLPAILITNRNPHVFRECYSEITGPVEQGLKLVLIPLRKFCKTTTEVAALIERLFADIQTGKELAAFRIGKKVRKGARAMADALVLEPSQKDKSVTLEEIVEFIKGTTKTSGHTTLLPKTVHPIHFEDFSGQQFEWLTFAYLQKIKQWDSLQWLGQTGYDKGRDIWGVFGKETYCYQCANFQKLTAKKATDDIDKLHKQGKLPDYFIVVSGGTVTPKTRDSIVNYGVSKGFRNVEVWSGRELEEKLRVSAPNILQRFIEGQAFPENKAVDTVQRDEEITHQLFECFDRPAFTTHFRQEVNIPDFEKAITDTIEVLNTGVHRLRDGTLIRRISSRHSVSDNTLKNKLAELARQVTGLRDTFVQLKRAKEIRPCGCDQDDCPVWFFTDDAAEQMDGLRRNIFKQLREIHPNFNLKFN